MTKFDLLVPSPDMTTEVRTPFGAPSPIELSSDGLYRKQILKFGTISYTGRDGKKRRITFDRKYGEDLVRAFQAGAYEQVPFQLADADNRHTNDPTRTAGEVVAVALSKDGSGLDGFLRLSDKGREVVLTNPKLGVSARILENAELGGRTFPRALQHVLGTVDPQVRGMSPWQKVDSVELSGGTVSESVDLSAATYEGSAMSGQNGTGETRTIELSTAMADRLERLLEEDEGLEELANQLEALGINLDDLDDEETEGDEEEPEGEEGEEEAETELSGTYSEAIELANAQLASQETRIVELTSQLTRQRVQAENDHYAREGLAPAVLSAAAPLLAVESGALELSNVGPDGDAVDPGEVIREVLNTVIELAHSGHLLIDETESGSLQADDATESRRKALLDDWDSYGN